MDHLSGYNRSMDPRRQLEEAIAALEAQRSLLGDAVVEVALASLREKLAALQPPAAHPEGGPPEQRKQVTALFADLVSFTAMAEKMDPEDVREIMDGYFQRWAEKILAAGGAVEKFIGDAVVGVFGLPAAREDDPQRAVEAALAMRQALEELNDGLEREWGLRLAMRVGICTGPVVVRYTGERLDQDFLVVGDTMNVASRLQELAPTNGILLAQDTYRHVRGLFQFQALEPIAVRGKEKPVRAYLVTGGRPPTFHLATRGLEGVETPMIGREAEWEALLDAFEAVVEAGEQRAVTIVGEAGLGKSRLIYEFDRYVEQQPGVIFFFKGRAMPAMQHLAYSLLRDMLAYHFQIHEGDPPDLVCQKIQEWTVDFGPHPEDSREVDDFCRLLGLENGRKAYGKAFALLQSAEQARQLHERALASFTEYLVSLAWRGPVVILLEDIHWADDSSLDILEQLSAALERRPRPMHALLVATARPTLYERRPAWGEGQRQHTCLELQPLSLEDSRRLVGELLQRAAAGPGALADRVAAAAEGNPFYIEEIVKMLIEEGVIRKGETGWQVEAARLAELRVPPTLVGILQARFESLEPEERLLLQRASAIGRVFWADAVIALGEEHAPEEKERVREADVAADREAGIREAFRRLCARQMISPHAPSTFEGTQEYLFAHNLFRDMTYETVLKRDRRVYHARLARWLEEATRRSWRQEEWAALIAEHYDQAGERERALDWFTRAGSHAAARFANAEAVRCLSRALELTPQEDPPARYRLLLQREKVLDLQGDRRAQASDLDALRRLAAVLDEQGARAPSAGPVSRRAEVALRRAAFADVTGDYAAEAEAAQEAVSLARAAGCRDHEAAGYLRWGQALQRQAAYGPAAEKLERAMELARLASLPSLEAGSLRGLGLVYLKQDQFVRARNALEQALELFREQGDRQEETACLNTIGTTYFSEGDFTAAAAHYALALQGFTAIGDRRGEGMAQNNLGVVYQGLGDFARARGYYEQSLAASRETADLFGQTIALNNLGITSHRLGDLAGAQRYYEQSLRLCAEIGEWGGEAAALTNLGLLAYHRGDFTAALSYQDQSQAQAAAHGDLYLQSCALLRTARVRLDQGLLAEAAAAFEQCLAMRRNQKRVNQFPEPLAGLAWAAMRQGETARAFELVNEILEILARPDSHLLDNADDPYWVYLACLDVLDVRQDPRAPRLLAEAGELLAGQAAQIADLPQREAFLQYLPSHRALISAWEGSDADRPVPDTQ